MSPSSVIHRVLLLTTQKLEPRLPMSGFLFLEEDLSVISFIIVQSRIHKILSIMGANLDAVLFDDAAVPQFIYSLIS